MPLPPELAEIFGETSNVFQRARLISRELIAENTLALTIERPQGFYFTPGQNTMISLPGAHADDLKEFTIASAPSDREILLAMRVRGSDFKKACYRLVPDDVIMMRNPTGALWHATAVPQIWLSGGIGITPFRSIIRELMHRNAPRAVTHIHSDRTRASVPFLQEFESYAAELEGFNFFSTMTREVGQAGVRGRITSEMIARHAPKSAGSFFFVAGTDAFIGAMREVLAEIGVSAPNIRTERFDGYK